MRLLQLSLVLVTTMGGAARAQLAVDSVEARVGIFDQDGEGYQSKDGPREGPGSEAATVVEPILRVVLRDGETWTHDAVVDVDVVSAASPDAVDAVSTASRVNTAVGLDVTSSHMPSGVSLRYGAHIEEPLRSFFLGAGYVRGFAEENTVLTASLRATLDLPDLDRHDASEGDVLHREGLNVNLGVSQIVSPTTRVDAGYGLTLQSGTLQTTYNSVPVSNGTRAGELFPRRRARHAFTAGVAQIVPATHTTGKASYRFYIDDFGLRAHTVQLWLYQRLGPWLTARLGYRHHDQTGADFYAEVFSPEQLMSPHTSDSDLAPLISRHLEAQLVFDAERSGIGWLGRSLVDVSVARYARDNGLESMIVSIGWGKRF